MGSPIFSILKQHYDQALQRAWQPGRFSTFEDERIRRFFLGDRFRCFIDDAWWPGSVVKREPFDSRHETSPFQCFIIRWENGESEERLSPWDIFPV